MLYLKAGHGGFTSQKSFEKHMKKDFLKFSNKNYHDKS
jgi:hypothetical protein